MQNLILEGLKDYYSNTEGVIYDLKNSLERLLLFHIKTKDVGVSLNRFEIFCPNKIHFEGTLEPFFEIC
jgi:hypothetical protein